MLDHGSCRELSQGTLALECLGATWVIILEGMLHFELVLEKTSRKKDGDVGGENDFYLPRHGVYKNIIVPEIFLFCC